MLWLMTVDGALHLAPLDNPRHVLDIATGTGTWALEFGSFFSPSSLSVSVPCSVLAPAKAIKPGSQALYLSTAAILTFSLFAQCPNIILASQYPNAHVTGTDLSPIQPTYIPPNCDFEIHDAEEDWTFSRPFDYIHGRALLSCFQNPASIIAKAWDSLAPGGYLELQDGLFPFSFLDPQPPTDGVLKTWFGSVLDASYRLGRPWDNAQHYARWMVEQGFEDVVEKRYFWPHGTWAKGGKMKRIGVAFREDMSAAVEAISMKLFTKVLGREEDAVRANIEDVVDAMNTKGVYMFETV